MFDFEAFGLVGWQWVLLGLCGFMVGVAKTGIPGFGILVVPLMAIAIGDPRKSVAVLLPMLIFADIFAVVYHRRNCKWGHVLKLLPAAFVGIFVGYKLMDLVNDDQLGRIMGVIVLIMLGLRWWQVSKTKSGGELTVPSHWSFAAVMGFTAGVTTMMANAAGPVMILYLLAMRLDKKEFVGTGAWFFFLINWIKVIPHIKMKTITTETLRLDVVLFGFIVIGAFAGIFALKKIPQKAFTVLVQILTAGVAIKLLF